MLRLLIILLLVSSSALAQLIVQVTLPTLSITSNISISLVPELVVIEQIPEATGIVVTYQASDPMAVFHHHDADLQSRGWQQAKYDAKNGTYKAHYRKGKDHAKLEVSDKHGQIEVKIKEGKD